MRTAQWIARLAGLVIAGGITSSVPAAQLVVGQVAPLTGIDASQGRAYAAGMLLHFNAVNKAGGVNGNTFTLARRDDAGRPDETLSQTRALLAEDKPVVLAGYFGSRNIAQLISAGVFERERIVLVGFRATELNLDAPQLYGVRATLRDELARITAHLATVGITRLGLFHENGSGAAPLIAAAQEAAANAKARIVQTAGYDTGTNRVSAAADAMLQAAPQAIIMIASGGAASNFVEKYRSAGGTAQLFAHSGADIEQMSKRLSEEQMQGIAIAQVTPSPYKMTNRLSKEFNDVAATAGAQDVPISYAMMEGFIAAKVIVEAARRQGTRVTREGFASALDGLESLDLGGYVIGFRPGMRNGSRFVEMTIISGNGRIRQ
ncbi:ABC transporter substrate-binding protein [Polaromonas sp. LjRoot131]|uniref:ABC transporter substrate-binding protein n=1 Tax=Polaromonas sp. LjRoot131 TaxID=3342262 RepID=UPI003ED1250F